MKNLAPLAFAAQVLRISVPYVLAALGGVWSERSGVINIALEGMLLAGAFGATVGSLGALGFGGGAVAGVLAGVLAGMALAAIYGLAVIRWRADQIVCGVAVTLLASGATRYFLKLAFGSTSNSPRIEGFAAPAWAASSAASSVASSAGGGSAGGAVVGFLGQTLGSPLLVAAVLLVALTHWGLYRTRFGLRLRAAGEHPEAAESLGVRVVPLRWRGVLLSGALAGLGGVWLAYDQHGFVANMSAGRGFIALAAMIVGGWSPLGAVGACLLFGLAEATQLRLQGSVLASGSSGAGLIQALPYLLTITALAVRARGRAAPRALGRPL